MIASCKCWCVFLTERWVKVGRVLGMGEMSTLEMHSIWKLAEVMIEFRDMVWGKDAMLNLRYLSFIHKRNFGENKYTRFDNDIFLRD